MGIWNVMYGDAAWQPRTVRVLFCEQCGHILGMELTSEQEEKRLANHIAKAHLPTVPDAPILVEDPVPVDVLPDEPLESDWVGQ